MFGQHGLFFNFLLPLAVLSLIPLSVIWVIGLGRRPVLGKLISESRRQSK